MAVRSAEGRGMLATALDLLLYSLWGQVPMRSQVPYATSCMALSLVGKYLRYAFMQVVIMTAMGRGVLLKGERLKGGVWTKK